MMQSRTTTNAVAVAVVVFSGSHSHHSSLRWGNSITWRRVAGGSVDIL
ncbi:MAG: hypothetical protein FWH37_07265 [Candidatus Bathyarchaeota archaeon]|nr:hypothetical protein [Candidatus Termiticorpusculum sp.]